MSWTRTAAVVLLGTLVSPALAQRPVSAASHQLYRDWEQQQLEAVQASASVFMAQAGTHLRIIVAGADSISCPRLRVQTVESAEERVDTARFTAVADRCLATLERPRRPSGVLVIRSLDEATLPPIRVAVGTHTREIALAIQTGIFGDRVAVSRWPEGAQDSWWRNAVDWLPGVTLAGVSNREQRLSRPLWQLVRQSCERSAPDAQTAAALFGLLKTAPVADYTTEEMRVLAICAIDAGWVETAERAVAHWASLDEESEGLAHVRVQLAALQFRVGAYGAVAGLHVSAPDIADAMHLKHLKSMALMALSRHAEAAELLLRGEHLASPITASGKASHLGLYMRFNLATALLASGESGRAWAVLDALGQTEAADRQAQALIDRANLVLGWQFLNGGSAASATPIFGRVATDGPYSRQAMLGVGWSWLVDRGEARRRIAEPTSDRPVERSPAVLKALYQHRKISCEEYRQAMGDGAVCMRPATYRRFAERSAHYREATAATYWLRLLQMDLADPASIEAAIALADAANAKAQHEPAKALYQRSIAAIESQLEALNKVSPYALEDFSQLPVPLQEWGLEAEPYLLRQLLRSPDDVTGSLRGRQSDLPTGDSERPLSARVREQLGGLFAARRARLQQQLESYLLDARYKYAALITGQS